MFHPFLVPVLLIPPAIQKPIKILISDLRFQSIYNNLLIDCLIDNVFIMLIYERPTARFSRRGLVGGILMGVQLYKMSFQVVKVRRSAYLQFPLFVDLTQRKLIRLNTIGCKLAYDNKPFFRSDCN